MPCTPGRSCCTSPEALLHREGDIALLLQETRRIPDRDPGVALASGLRAVTRLESDRSPVFSGTGDARERRADGGPADGDNKVERAGIGLARGRQMPWKMPYGGAPA